MASEQVTKKVNQKAAAEQHLRPHWIAVRSKYLPVSLKLDRRVPLMALAILAFTLVVLVLSISYGEYDISPVDVVRTLLGTLPQDHPEFRNYNLVVHTFRLPRILTAFLVGAALATSGAIMQGITRNPLAEPGILGVSAGAGLAAVSVIVWFKDVPISWLPWAAFGGALLTAIAIYTLSWKDGGSAPVRLILIGVAFAAVLGSLTSFMLVFGDINDVQQAYVWLTGSVYGRNWEHVRTMSLWLLILLPIAIFSARQLNILNLGDEIARGLGMRVEAQRVLLLVISVALAAAAVAVAGTIGFVGLVAPHITRRLVGPSHDGMIPVTALFGGALLVLADLIGRWIISPSELPIGIVTALIGAPYFMYLLYRYRN
ncbi:iron ABC transporter permease [Phototrophicus methaneseepsis]|uniref:Iron ABC transporter permease n=1 Tax=Phototrophicus methaneseepsis TaxID=2710758 RepID=A0A7S8E7J2_9CHLR|nr:iron ABC transporter permease [Phototrophicus methaneseepsis]QPC81816.1 iron ABC transporter permease [Phototrophicus methaneseepsis]